MLPRSRPPLVLDEIVVIDFTLRTESEIFRSGKAGSASGRDVLVQEKSLAVFLADVESVRGYTRTGNENFIVIAPYCRIVYSAFQTLLCRSVLVAAGKQVTQCSSRCYTEM